MRDGWPSSVVGGETASGPPPHPPVVAVLLLLPALLVLPKSRSPITLIRMRAVFPGRYL